MTICFDISPDLAFRLRQISRRDNMSEETLINRLIQDYIQNNDTKNAQSADNEFRKHQRLDVSIPAIIEIKISENETQYKPATIINISAGGARIRVDGKASRIVENFKRQMPFTMTFCVTPLSQIVQILCKPIHFTISTVIEIGTTFQNTPPSLREALQQQFR
jgi:hypothetical protein